MADSAMLPAAGLAKRRHRDELLESPLARSSSYEQPLTRADIRAIRGIDSDAVVETLMACRLVAEDPRVTAGADLHNATSIMPPADHRTTDRSRSDI